MNKSKFIQLLDLNRELANSLHSMTKEEMATTKGGKIFRDMHKTDLQIARLVSSSRQFEKIIERMY
jgi:hypothetical protein